MEETENPLELGKVDANPDLESDTFQMMIYPLKVKRSTGQPDRLVMHLE